MKGKKKSRKHKILPDFDNYNTYYNKNLPLKISKTA